MLLLLNTFYHRYTAIVFRAVIFETFWQLQKLFVICYVFFYPETSNFHNSEKVGPRKLPDLSMNIYHFIIYRLQYTLLIKRPDFGLKFLVTITPKVQSLKLKANVGMKQVNCSSLFNLFMVTELLLWNRKEI